MGGGIADQLKRAAGPGIVAILGFAFQLTGWEVAWLGYVLFAVAGLWAFAVYLWPPLLDHIALAVSERLPTPSPGRGSRTDPRVPLVAAKVAEDLEAFQAMLKNRDDDRFIRWYSIRKANWDREGALLALSPVPDLHRTVRRAYLALDQAFNDSPTANRPPSPNLGHVLRDESASEALEVVHAALAKLHEAETGGVC